MSTADEWRLAQDIRTEVFIHEQRCSPAEEWDEYDATSRHLLAWLGDSAVGVARWRAVPSGDRVVAKLERFAILKGHRRRGLGRELIVRTMEDARRAGFSDFIVHAQTYLEALYRQLGFEVEGETFVEAGIPHVRMIRRDQNGG